MIGENRRWTTRTYRWRSRRLWSRFWFTGEGDVPLNDWKWRWTGAFESQRTQFFIGQRRHRQNSDHGILVGGNRLPLGLSWTTNWPCTRSPPQSKHFHRVIYTTYRIDSPHHQLNLIDWFWPRFASREREWRETIVQRYNSPRERERCRRHR